MYLKKKGFTLVELIVTIFLILLIMTIAIPNIINIANKNQTKEYNSYVNHFTKGTQLYVADNITVDSECSSFTNPINVTLNTLINGEYIEEDLPINPKTKTKFKSNSYVSITCSNGLLSYSFNNIR